jgi:hypothetical protein
MTAPRTLRPYQTDLVAEIERETDGGAARCVNPSFCSTCREADRRRDRGERPRYTGAQRNPPAHIPHDWEDMTLDELGELFNRQHPTPQATIEAMMQSVRERGLGALKEPANIERLVRCGQAAKEQIDRRIAKLVAEGRVS